MNPASDERLANLLGGDHLAALRRRLRFRFERTPLPGDPTSFRIGSLTPNEHAALASLMSRSPRLTDSLQVDVKLIDAKLLRANIAPSLRHALEWLDGPILHRATFLAQQQAGWSKIIAGCRHPALAHLLQMPGKVGLLKRLSRSDPDMAVWLCQQADEVLHCLPASGVPRAQLSAGILGDAHALDDGHPIATIVLAAWRSLVPAHLDEPEINKLEEAAQPGLREERTRDVWAACGVLVNELARPALFLNLPIHATTDHDQQHEGEPAFVSLRALLRSPRLWNVAGRKIYVCENPNLVAIAADKLGARCAPLVCTDGMPAAAQRSLLIQLSTAGACLHVHADFDWPGIRIARHVIQTYEAQPWQLSTLDYETAVRSAPRPGRSLDGLPVEATWDEGLTDAMQRYRMAVDEEAVAGSLLTDLEK